MNIVLVAGSSARRALLAERVQRVFLRRGAEVFSRSAFFPPLEQAHAILVADLDSVASSANMLRYLKESPGETGSVALADDPQPDWVREALSAGVNAIISREADAEELRLAVECAEAGLVLLHPTSARDLAAGRMLGRAFSEQNQVEHLTARECQVLRLISDGLGNKEIASRLGVSEHTVKFHTSSILGKLGAASRTEAVTEGIRRGVIPI